MSIKDAFEVFDIMLPQSLFSQKLLVPSLIKVNVVNKLRIVASHRSLSSLSCCW
jgi:hypothetical protein